MEKSVVEIVNQVENKRLKTVTLKVCKNFMEKFSKKLDIDIKILIFGDDFRKIHKLNFTS